MNKGPQLSSKDFDQKKHPLRMAKSDSVFTSIIKIKCPRCHEGDMFPPGTLYSFSKFAKMNKNCSQCGQSFEPEPGFYFGAMFISYGLSSAIFVAVWVILNLIMEEVTFVVMMTAVVAIVFGLLPINFRLSRSMWIHMTVKYKGPPNGQR